jgi:capsular polysaccharide biosynthesis protein
MSFNQENTINEVINFRELVDLLWKSKYFVLIGFLAFYLIGSIYSSSLTPQYSSTALLKSVGSSSIASGGGSSLNNVAKLVGLGTSKEISKTVVALEMLKSKSFFSSFYNDPVLLAELVAYDDYDKITGETIFNSSYIDSEGNWKVVKPDLVDLHGSFLSHITITRDESGFIYMTTSHPSPFIALKWNNWLFSAIDEYIRVREIEKAQKAVDYLEQKLSSVKNIELQAGITTMIQNQLATLLLAEISENFVFEMIDKPYLAKGPSSPNKSLLRMFFSIFGILISIVMVLTLHYLGYKIRFEVWPLEFSFNKS